MREIMKDKKIVEYRVPGIKVAILIDKGSKRDKELAAMSQEDLREYILKIVKMNPKVFDSDEKVYVDSNR